MNTKVIPCREVLYPLGRLISLGRAEAWKTRIRHDRHDIVRESMRSGGQTGPIGCSFGAIGCSFGTKRVQIRYWRSIALRLERE